MHHNDLEGMTDEPLPNESSVVGQMLDPNFAPTSAEAEASVSEVPPEEISTDLEMESARVIPCPHCACLLDVAAYDPLASIQCPGCSQNFDLLKEYGLYQLQAIWATGDGQEVFVAKRAGGGQALLWFLPASFYPTADSLELFLRAAGEVANRCDLRYVESCFLEHHHGFIAQVFELKQGILPEAFFPQLCLPSHFASPETAPSTEVIACPRCGQRLENAEEPHLCQIPEPVAEVGTLSSLDLGPRETPCYALCSSCGLDLTVDAFSPLDQLECPNCKASFALLERFAEFKILRQLKGTWQNPLYLASGPSGERVLLVVMGPEIRGQEASMDKFTEEVSSLHALLNVEWIENAFADRFNGFSYFGFVIQPEVPEADLLGVFGIVDAPADVADDLGACIITCPKCSAPMDGGFFDPLDEAICVSCGNTFEVLRQFGHYLVDYRLSSGGTSYLYLARDMNSVRKVALKVLRSSYVRRVPGSVASFIREGELTRRLNHPNIVEVYECGVFNGRSFMALQLVEGLTLEEILLRIQKESDSTFEGPNSNIGPNQFSAGVPEIVCLDVMLQAAAGLGKAHELGFVHGDVKPANIMLTYGGVVKVLDFGLGRFANTDQLLDTEETIYGTPLYIPPERVFREPEDFRSDIYSLGATLYHLLRGVAPFRAKTAAEIALMHTRSPVIRFKAFVPKASDTVCRIVEKSLKKMIGDRYGSHIEFIADLTLARQLVLRTMAKPPKSGQACLAAFMKTVPAKSSPGSVWHRAATQAVHVYKFMTMAITARIKRAS